MIKHSTNRLLTEAEQLLGGETCETDFLESSDWPLRRLDVYVSRCLSVWLTYLRVFLRMFDIRGAVIACKNEKRSYSEIISK